MYENGILILFCFDLSSDAMSSEGKPSANDILYFFLITFSFKILFHLYVYFIMDMNLKIKVKFNLFKMRNLLESYYCFWIKKLYI